MIFNIIISILVSYLWFLFNRSRVVNALNYTAVTLNVAKHILVNGDL